MTISTETRKAGPFIGPSNALNFPFHFKVFNQDDVAVFRETNAQVKRLALTTDYSVTLSANGGTVTLKAALGTGERLVIESAVPLLQPLQLENQGGFYPHVLNDAFDRSCMQIQQLAQTLSRAVLVPETSDTNPKQLIAELKADKQAAQQSASAAATSASAAANSAGAIHSDLAAAASHASAAQTSASNAANSTSAAANSASAAATSKTQAATSATQAASSATNAAGSASAAQTSATNAASSATEANTSKTQATTSANAAASSATSAQTAQTQAQTFSNQAEAHKNQAQAWADNNENVVVETGKYSAKHWAAKAQQTASSVNAADIAAQLATINGQIAALQTAVNNPPPAFQLPVRIWRHLTMTRTFNKTYQNLDSSERVIMVNDMLNPSNFMRFTLKVHDTADINNSPHIESWILKPMDFTYVSLIVPPNWFYILEKTSGSSNNAAIWSEFSETSQVAEWP